MANIVVTQLGNSIIVDFNDYATIIGSIKRSYDKSDLSEIELDNNNVVVLVKQANGINKWYLTYDTNYIGQDYFIVDSILGVTPTSNLDLFNKITALRG